MVSGGRPQDGGPLGSRMSVEYKVLVYFAAIAVAYAATLRLWAERWRNKVDEFKGIRESLTIFPALLFGVFAFLSHPLAGFLEQSIQGSTDKARRKLIDMWVLFWLSFNGAVLLALPKYPMAVLLVIFPFLRLFDLLQTLFALLLFQREEALKGRSLGLLMLHLTEVVVAFACFYLAIQQVAGEHLFYVGDELRGLRASTAFYFSFITAATVGFGDITPNTADSFAAGLTRFLVTLEILVSLFVILVSIPRAVSIPEQLRWNPHVKRFEHAP